MTTAVQTAAYDRDVRPEVVRPGIRLGAALLDGLVAWALLAVPALIWTAAADQPPPGAAVPGGVQAASLGLVWLYLTAGTARGATLGKLALGVRVRRAADAAPPGVLRAGTRSLALVAVLWMLGAPLILLLALVYLALGRRSARWVLPHDRLAGTVTVPAGLPAPGAVPPPATGALPPRAARALLRDLGAVRRRAAGAGYRTAAPALALGAVVLGAAALTALTGPPWPQLYWTAAGPVGLLLTAAWYRRQRRRDGGGPGARDVLVIAALVACGSVPAAFVGVGPVVTAAGFLAVAVRRHAPAPGAAAVLVGLVAGLETPYRVLSSPLEPRLAALAGGAGDPAGAAVLAALGAAVLLIGGVTLHRERRP